MSVSQANVNAAITEDEAALYDRQIRLWGLEAQQRMRNATIMIVTLKGLATEVIKNIVLAGIGKLIVMDGENVSAADLGAGFFFTEEDVGTNRAAAAKSRIQSLNPLVTVEVIAEDVGLQLQSAERLEALVSTVNLVCVTDSGKDVIVRLDEICHRQKKMFYTGATFGMLGFVFSDLGTHDFVARDRTTSANDEPKMVKQTLVYPPFATALQHSWKALNKRQTRELNPAVVFTVLAILEWQSIHKSLPDDPSVAPTLELLANELLHARSVNSDTITAVPTYLVESAATTAAHEFSPVCAVVGGVLAQDILRALAAKDAPLANFFTFNGSVGGGTVCSLGVIAGNA